MPATHRWTAEEISAAGERATHLCANDCYYAHLSICRFAAPLCEGKIVLDAGCGAGYGSAYLAEHGAASVDGIDVSAQAIAFDRQYFQAPNLRYHVMSMESIAGFAPHSFDVVFSSNALEHVRDVGAFLAGVCRYLRPEGKFLLAVPPVVNEVTRGWNADDVYHLNIWSPRQWHYVLKSYFETIQCYAHGFYKEGVELDFRRTPEHTVIDEADFFFTPVRLEDLYHAPTLTALFVLEDPRCEGELPRQRAPITFIDNSYSRGPARATLLRGLQKAANVKQWTHRRLAGLLNR